MAHPALFSRQFLFNRRESVPEEGGLGSSEELPFLGLQAACVEHTIGKAFGVYGKPSSMDENINRPWISFLACARPKKRNTE